ncbi:thioredoxin domain-containing protein [Lichenicoccus sp.]|uniref:thioredoxin domain-containing protein n=1 Tax=Lichenicoccus sp. TaxID=2781899 RepID=UPI003D14146C
MPTLLRRRHLLGASLALGAALASLRGAYAQGADPRMALRALGNPKAKVTVQEWFSLTCTHCARFAAETFPEVKTKLIDTGKIYYEFKDFPLDQVALAAAMVARSLPADRYEPFVLALLSSQDRWAFNQGVDPQAALQQMAALAGMPKATFEAAINDQALKHEILAEQDRGATKLHIDSTPTFIIGTSQHAGEMTYDAFLKAVDAAAA